jgi:hypothetical protein
MVTMEKIETAYSLSPINRELLISEAANAWPNPTNEQAAF